MNHLEKTIEDRLALAFQHTGGKTADEGHGLAIERDNRWRITDPGAIRLSSVCLDDRWSCHSLCHEFSPALGMNFAHRNGRFIRRFESMINSPIGKN